MTYNTHNTKKIDTNGTSFQGNINCSFETLLNKFGTPLGASADDKVDVEWNIQFDNGVISTIYNWKNGPVYCGKDGINPVNNTDWNVGGKNQHSLWEIEQILENSA
jgi:hypothetical protein